MRSWVARYLFLAVFAVSSFAAANTCGDVFFTSTFVYPEVLRELKPKVPHTIEDMNSYLVSKLGAELVKDAQRDAAQFFVVQGAAENPLQVFRSSEIQFVKEISNPFGAFNVTQVRLKSGQNNYLITNVNGESRFLQVLSFLRLIGVKDNRINLAGKMHDYHSLYMQTFESIGEKPDLVVFGFSNTSFEVISESLVHVRPNVRADLKNKNSSYANRKWEKPSFKDHELQNMGIQILKFKNGKKIWFIDNEYGDRAATLMNAMQDFGVRNILLLGTAGSLNPKYKVGMLVSPESFHKDSGQVIPANFTEGLSAREGKHGHVDSPAMETKAWLQKQIEQGVDYIDVELQKASAVVRKDTKYDGYLVISDELNSHTTKDYTKWVESDRQQTKNTLLPLLQKSLEDIGLGKNSEVQSYDIEYFKVQHNLKETEL